MEKDDYIAVIFEAYKDLKRQESNIINYMEDSIYISDNDYINEELNIIIHEKQLLEEILEKIRNKKEGN